MSESLKFGTSGWRGILAEEVTYSRIRKLTRAITKQLYDSEEAFKGIIIGYDTRFLSWEFACEVASVCAEEGIKVFITDKPCPTPVVSFEILNKRAAGGINITASHNPYYYSGVKFSPSWGGPAEPELTAVIENHFPLASDAKPRENFEYYRKNGKIEVYSPLPEYLAALKKVIPFPMDFNFPIVFDPLFGTAIPYLNTLFKNNSQVSIIHKTIDPLFGGLEPVPYEHVLTPLRKTLKKKQAKLGLALDGDADRFGVISHDGRFITPNEVFVILAYYLGQKNGSGIGRSISTTRMLDVIASFHQVELFETPVGFKYLGALIRDRLIYLGGEESGGMSIGGWIPEKDGILAVLLVLGLCTKTGCTPAELIDGLYRRFGRFYNQRLDIKYSEKQAGQVNDFINNFSASSLFGIKIKEMVRGDGLLIIFEDNSWCLLRLSGTENLIRYYLESPDIDLFKKLEQSTFPFLK